MVNQSSCTYIYKNVAANCEELKKILGDPSDLSLEFHGSDHNVCIAYLESIIDEKDIKTNILQPLLSILSERNLSLEKVAAFLPETGSRQLNTLEAVVSDLLDGRTVVFLDKQSSALSFRTQGWAKHEPKEPESEQIVRGPREGFTETLSENIGMVRRWIKDPHLRTDSLEIGRRTKTKVAVMYLRDVADPRIVKEVKKRLSAIDIDGVLESSYLEHLITDRRLSIFPLTQATERSDKVTAAILEGRVAILVDKSPAVILVPVTINELYQSPQDYYYDFWLGSFIRMIRLLGNILAVGLSGLYISFVAFDPELLPAQFAFTIAYSRANNPLPLAAEVLMLELAIEVFREAGLRLPGIISQTLGIVAGITLGQAALMSGLVSPVTTMVVAIGAIASFTVPNYAVGLTWRVLRYLFIIGAGIFGFFGLTIVGVLVVVLAADMKSFGVSYLAPWAPLQWLELTDGPVRAPLWFRWLRPKTYRPHDRLRQGGTKGDDHEND